MNKIGTFQEAVKLLHSSDISKVLPPYLVDLYKIIKIKEAITKGDGKYDLSEGDYFIPSIFLVEAEAKDRVKVEDRLGVISINSRKYLVATMSPPAYSMGTGLMGKDYETDDDNNKIVYMFPALYRCLACRTADEADYLQKHFGKTLTMAILNIIAYGRFKELGFKQGIE